MSHMNFFCILKILILILFASKKPYLRANLGFKETFSLIHSHFKVSKIQIIFDNKMSYWGRGVRQGYCHILFEWPPKLYR